ncbi:BTAD domain-containing putative transcriptional regulator [Streptomyces sp. NPDC002067]
MEFRLLGAVSVVTEVGDLPLGPAKRRSLLAALLLRSNHPVPVEALTDALWDQEPPPRARSVIQGHVSRLRSLMSDAGAGMYGVELVTQGAAYVLRMPESLLDAHRFEELVALARGQRAAGDAVAMYQEALALWQGPALTGAYRSAPLQSAAHALEELRLTTVELLAEAYGQLGEYARAAALLRAEAAAQPLRESLSAALIRVLQQAGRRSEALDWFHRTRRLLAEELGVDPGRELADAYAVVLRGDDCTAPPAVPAAPAAPPEPRPAPPVKTAPPETVDLLPRVPRGFHGRAEELAALDRAATGEAPVCLVTGPAGVGKTALVVHWAHLNRDRFPGGLLYADLRGFSDTPEAEPAEVVREFLLALGVGPRRIPESASGASALFRSLAAGRELLVVLDNAPGSAQVQELLPGGARCVTVVTSRHRLPGLIASDAARPVPVDVLGPDDGTALLAGVLGAERVRAEPGAARRLAELCGGLPLALRVTAARLTDQPEWSLSTLSGELSDESRRLGLLDVENTGVRAALRLTVRRLPADAAHHFAHLGRHPGTHFDRYTAAALAGTDPAAAEAALERLAAAHLVTRAAPDRWTLHDLVRLYARGLDADPDTLVRALDHSVATALAAADAAEPGDESCFPLPDDHHAPREIRRFAGRDEAMAWYESEREGLTLAAVAADAAGLHSRTWRLVLGMWPQIVWRVREGWSPLLGTALAAARADGDLRAQSRILALLGWVLTEEGRVPEALAHLEAAPVLAARAGDVRAQATALVNLSLAQAALGSPQEAAQECADAARLARSAGDPYTERLALYHLTRHHLDCGAWKAALVTVAAAQKLDEAADTSVAGRVLLIAAAGEALLGMGDEAGGAARLREAADTAEACGFDDGVVRALGVLLKVPTAADPQLQERYDNALARLRSRP